MSDMSFREKSICGTLVAVSVVAALYFWTVVEMLGAGTVNLVALGKLAVSLTIFFIIVEIVFHAVIAARSPRDAGESEDERDRLIDLKGERVGGLLLGIGVAFTIGHIALNSLMESVVSPHSGLTELLSSSHFVTANLLLFSLTVSEIGKYVSQLVYYRRGA
ncbi:MAG: hypothetical protein WD795_12305 [Woeseia sp.]